MDGAGGSTLFPLHRCKTIHLVRHAQGIHNVEGDKNYKAYMSTEYFDAHLTQLGWQQVDNLRKHVHACDLIKKIDLVITSPLLRTMQTAVGVFGGEGYTDRMDVIPLMAANAGNSGRAAISSLDAPPIIAVELCREHLGVHPCDKRRSVSEYQYLFPAIDFSLIESDEDLLWKANIRETQQELAERGRNFLNWMCYTNISVVHTIVIKSSRSRRYLDDISSSRSGMWTKYPEISAEISISRRYIDEISIFRSTTEMERYDELITMVHTGYGHGKKRR